MIIQLIKMYRWCFGKFWKNQDADFCTSNISEALKILKSISEIAWFNWELSAQLFRYLYYCGIWNTVRNVSRRFYSNFLPWHTAIDYYVCIELFRDSCGYVFVLWQPIIVYNSWILLFESFIRRSKAGLKIPSRPSQPSFNCKSTDPPPALQRSRISFTPPK